jgi:hypothetical protein
LIVRLESGRSTLAQLAFTDLGGLVAVDLLRGDLGELVVPEEGQQVMGQRQLVVLDGPLRELMASRLEPLGGELVERRLRDGFRCPLRLTRLPDAPPYVSEDVGELLLGLVARPALGARAERQVATLAIGAEAKGVGGTPLPLQLDHLPCRSPCHLASLDETTPEVNSPRCFCF